MALELSSFDMELLMSFSTPVDAKDVTTSTNSEAQLVSQTSDNSSSQQADHPPSTSDESSPPPSPNPHTKDTTNNSAKPAIATPPSSDSAIPENSKVIRVELTDKNEVTYQTSYLAEVIFTRDDFNKKKDNYKVKGSVTIYKCQQCPYQNPKIQSIKEHLINHRKYANSIQCRYCEYYAPYGLSLQQHEVLHNEYTPSERGFKSEKDKKKFCPECPYKAVKNREIKCHQLNHMYRDGYLKCRYCNYYLVNTKGMKQHEALHAVDKEFTFNVIGQSPRQQRKQAANQSGASCPARTSTQVQQQHQLQQLQTQHRRQQHYSPIHVQAQHGQFEPQQQNVFPQQQNVNMYSRYQQPQSVCQYGHSTEVYHQHIPQQQPGLLQSQQQHVVVLSPSNIFAQVQSPNPHLPHQQHAQQQPQSFHDPTASVQNRQTIAQHFNNNIDPSFHHSAHPNKSTTTQQQQQQQLSQSEISILKNSLKEKEITEKVETLNIADKVGREFSISYIVKKISTSSNKYREKGSSTVYCCQLCPYTTKFSTHLREHLPHHRLYPKSVKCRYCDYYASNTLNLKQHEILHPQYEVNIPKKNLSKKDRETPTAFKNERKMKRYKCKICPFDGQHPYLIVRHMQYHVYKDGFVKCKKCDYYLATSNNMKQHEVLHQVQELREQQIEKEIRKKKHLCRICPFRTIQKSHLERHMTFHNKNNFDLKKGYYTCQYCKYYSTNTGKMKQHEVLHTQEWDALIEEVATADISDCVESRDGDKQAEQCCENDGQDSGDEEEDVDMKSEAKEMSETGGVEVTDDDCDEGDDENDEDYDYSGEDKKHSE